MKQDGMITSIEELVEFLEARYGSDDLVERLIKKNLSEFERGSIEGEVRLVQEILSRCGMK